MGSNMATRRHRNLPALVTMPKVRKEPTIHPIFKQLLGTMLLAGNMKEAVEIGVSKKAFEWVNGGKGRAFHVINDGVNVTLTFTVDGKECKAPF